ncbi:MAG: GGDEF domain-containing protein [Syntrophaceae bacterium]|nr:GGDEF domain-containing protein [Syntrophaceae bacterium]
MNGEPTYMDEKEYGKIYLFKCVSLEAIRGLLDACTVRVVEKEEILIQPGQTNQTVYCILEGSLRVQADSLESIPDAILGPGENVGEMSVIDQQPATMFVVANEPSRLLCIDEDILWSLVHASHAAACNLLFSMTRRLRHTVESVGEDDRIELEVHHYGSVDALTGLRNRYWLDQTLKRQVQRAQIGGNPLSLILIGVDHFRLFNDKYGISYGNRVLYSLAHTISARLRPTEVVARHSECNFLVLLPDKNLEIASCIAERLYREIVDAVPIMPDGRRKPHPEISMGIAEMQMYDTPETLLQAVEASLCRVRDAVNYAVSD